MILAIKDFSKKGLLERLVIPSIINNVKDLIFRRKILNDPKKIRIHSIKLDNTIYTVSDITNLGRISYIEINGDSYNLQLFNYNTKFFESYCLPDNSIKVYKKVLEYDNGSLYECDMEKTIKIYLPSVNDINSMYEMNYIKMT